MKLKIVVASGLVLGYVAIKVYDRISLKRWERELKRRGDAYAAKLAADTEAWTRDLYDRNPHLLMSGVGTDKTSRLRQQIVEAIARGEEIHIEGKNWRSSWPFEVYRQASEVDPWPGDW